MKRVAYSSGNQLLDALPVRERAKNKADLEVISLVTHQVTHALDATIDFVDFPIDAIVSVVATLKNGTSVEVRTVGSDSTRPPRSERPFVRFGGRSDACRCSGSRIVCRRADRLRD